MYVNIFVDNISIFSFFFFYPSTTTTATRAAAASRCLHASAQRACRPSTGWTLRRTRPTMTRRGASSSLVCPCGQKSHQKTANELKKKKEKILISLIIYLFIYLFIYLLAYLFICLFFLRARQSSCQDFKAAQEE